MQNIGERLEEARKKKGLSIREAAEATKIRGDFLNDFENNRFGEIPLPEIYKRGFLKNYSKFLGMDSEKLLADYTAHQLGDSRLARKEGREFFGRMDMPYQARKAAREKAEQQQAGTESGPGVPEPRIETPPAPAEEPGEEHPFEPRETPRRDSRFASSEDRNSSLFGGDKTLYWKIGLAGGSAFVLFLLLFALIKAITSGGGQPEQPPIINNETAGNGSTTGSTTPPASGDRSEVILVGTGEVFVQVKQLSNGEILYKGTLSQGERVPLNIQGSADIAFTNGSNLRIIKDGETFEPNTERSQIGKINTDRL